MSSKAPPEYPGSPQAPPAAYYGSGGPGGFNNNGPYQQGPNMGYYEQPPHQNMQYGGQQPYGQPPYGGPPYGQPYGQYPQGGYYQQGGYYNDRGAGADSCLTALLGAAACCCCLDCLLF